jgi:hypothetical protein
LDYFAGFLAGAFFFAGAFLAMVFLGTSGAGEPIMGLTTFFDSFAMISGSQLSSTVTCAIEGL